MAEDLKPAETYDDRPIHSEAAAAAGGAGAAGRVQRASRRRRRNGSRTPSPRSRSGSSSTRCGSKIEVLAWGERRQARPAVRPRQQRPRRLVELHRPVLRRRLPGRRDVAGRHGRIGLARQLHLPRLRRRTPRPCRRGAGLYEAAASRSTSATRSAAGRCSSPPPRHPERMHAAILVDTGFGGPPPEELEPRKSAMERLAQHPDRRPAQPRLSDAGGGAGALPAHAAAAGRQPLHRSTSSPAAR